MSNAEIAHIWAQQSRESKSCGNMSFRGRSLYSYQTEIARFIDGKVVRTTHRYSVTTTGKHYPACFRAITHLESYATELEMRSIPDTWEEVAPILFTEMMCDLKTEIESLRKARVRIAYSVDRIAEHAHDAHRFYASYIRDKIAVELPQNAIGYDALFAMCAITATLTADQLPLGSFKTFNDVINERFGIDINSKIQKEKINEEKASVRFAEKLKRQEEERAERAARREIELAESIGKWRQGESVHNLYDCKVMLRVNGEVIETSHGARVPIDAAMLLWKFIEDGRTVIGFKIGDYTVNEVTEDVLKIGCHTIPMPEVKMMAEKLGL